MVVQPSQNICKYIVYAYWKSTIWQIPGYFCSTSILVSQCEQYSVKTGQKIISSKRLIWSRVRTLNVGFHKKPWSHFSWGWLPLQIVRQLFFLFFQPPCWQTNRTDRPLTISELQNPPIDVSEAQKARRFADFEALEMWKGRSDTATDTTVGRHYHHQPQQQHHWFFVCWQQNQFSQGSSSSHPLQMYNDKKWAW